MTLKLFHLDGRYIGSCEHPNTERQVILQACHDSTPIEAWGRQYRLKHVKAAHGAADIEGYAEDLGPIPTNYVDDC